MSFLDKAKEKATQLANTAKDRVDDFKDQRKADDLLADLGRITFREHTDAAESSDSAEIDRLIGELKSLQSEGAVIVAADTPEPPETEAPRSPGGFAPPTTTDDH